MGIFIIKSDQLEGDSAMKVLIISSSPRKGGNSDVLCDQFAKGAVEAGHEVEKVSLREKRLSPCRACLISLVSFSCSMLTYPFSKFPENCPWQDGFLRVCFVYDPRITTFQDSLGSMTRFVPDASSSFIVTRSGSSMVLRAS